MKQNKRSAFPWFLAGLIPTLLALLVVFQGLAGKVLIRDVKGIPEAANGVMCCIQSGDWAALEATVSGNPELAPAPGAADSVEQLLWTSYQNSLQWTCTEPFSLRGSQVLQPVCVTCLDIHGVTGAMAGILTDLPEPSPWPEDPALRLYAAAKQVLEQDPPMLESRITLTFLREKDRWLLVPDRALQTLLSGFTAQ